MTETGRLSSSQTNLIGCIPLTLAAIWAWKARPRPVRLSA